MKSPPQKQQPGSLQMQTENAQDKLQYNQKQSQQYYSIRSYLLYILSSQPYSGRTTGSCLRIPASRGHFQKQTVTRDLSFPSSCIKQHTRTCKFQQRYAFKHGMIISDSSSDMHLQAIMKAFNFRW